MLLTQGKKTQKLEQELQQGAAKRSSSQISVSQGGSKRSEGGEVQKQPTNLKNHSKTTREVMMMIMVKKPTHNTCPTVIFL